MPCRATQSRSRFGRVMKDKSNIAVSVIVPFYNEEENIELLYTKIRKAMEATEIPFEMVFVDDGSSDKTYAIGASLSEKDERLRVIKFKSNYGQTPAMAAGIDYAEGQVLVTMDGDLQNDPRDIRAFIEKIEEGFDIVVGWRHKRKDKFLTRKLPSKVANWVIGKVTGVPIKDNGCSLKAYRADVIKNVPLYSEMHRFIPAMASISGVKIAELKVRHHARQHGMSKYGLSRIYKVILDLISIKTLIGFSGRPLRWFGKLSFPFGLVGLVSFILALMRLWSHDTARALNFGAIALVMAATCTFLVALGVLGELIYRTGNMRVNDLAKITARFG